MILSFALSALAAPPTVGSATTAPSATEVGVSLDVPTNAAEPIVGGEKSAKGAWPDVAGIVFEGGRQNVGCTGTLVATTVVLTAGHCADGITAVRLDAPDYSVNSDGEYIKVKKVFEYPNSGRSYDITAVLLDSPSKITPRPIAMDCIIEEFLVDGASATIAGYGAYDQQGRRYDSYLREGEIEINDADCSVASDGCQRAVMPGGELSAGGDGTDTCYGDSGGPLYLHTPKGDFLAGVTSRGYNWVTVPCRDGGIYVRPDAVIDWIEESTGVELPRPDCSTNAWPEPTADDLVIAKNRDGVTRVFPNDPDDDQSHTFEITAEPSHAVAVIAADGTLTVTPDKDFLGEDSVTVAVTDNGDTPRVADLEIPIRVLTHSDYKKQTGLSVGCGCAGTGVSPGWLAAAFGLVLLRRRR